MNIRRYARPLCVVGGAISIYHLFVERFPSLEGGACDPNNPCSLIRVNRFGYLTIPTMALTGFTAIFLLVSMHRSQSKPES